MAGPYPEANAYVPQTPNLLGMAGQAAQLHNALLQGTGMGLEQHYKRLQGLVSGIEGAYIDNGQQPLTLPAVSSAVTKMVANGIATPSEGAAFLANAPKDPAELQGYVRQTLAGIHDNAAMLGKVMTQINGGDVTYSFNTNPNFKSGVNMPPVHQGLPPAAAAAPAGITGPNGENIQTTVGRRAQAMGQNIHSYVGNPLTRGNPGLTPHPVGPPPPVSSEPLAPSGPQLAQQTKTALSQTPTGIPVGAKGPSVPGAIVGPSPQRQSVLNTQAISGNADYSKLVRDATDPSVQQKLSSISDIMASINSATTGTGAERIGWVQGILGQIGIPTEGLTNKQIMDKAATLLSNSTLTGMGSQTNQALLSAVHANPNSGMTKDGIAATAAMVKAMIKYNQEMGLEAQKYFGNTPPTESQFNSWKATYGETAVTPFVLALGDMPPSERPNIQKFIMKLPKKQRDETLSQIREMYVKQ